MIRAIAKDRGFLLEDMLVDEQSDENDDHESSATVIYSPQDLLLNKNVAPTNTKSVYNYVFNDDSQLYETGNIEATVLAVLPPSAEWGPGDNHSAYGIVTCHTNMYAVKGGQDSDKGLVLCDGKAVATVDKVVELPSGHIIHWCTGIDPASRPPSLSSKVTLCVDAHQRTGTSLHHTCHHIVFAGINSLVGRVNQSSSSVKSDHARLSFTVDLSHGDPKILRQPDFTVNLERICNEVIGKAIPVEIRENVEFSSITGVSLGRFERCFVYL